jgi:hypothetical protein
LDDEWQQTDRESWRNMQVEHAENSNAEYNTAKSSERSGTE